MKNLTTLILVLHCIVGIPNQLQSQFTDQFLDGNISTNPSWLGDTSHFQVNTGNELWLNAPSLTSSSYLITPSNAIGNAQFDFYVRLDFNPSPSNYAKVYLTSTDSILSGNLNGYFVQIGGASGVLDDVSLYYQNGNSKTLIIDGVNGTVANTPSLNIRVTRDMMGNWELLIDTALTNTFVSQGAIFHNQTTICTYFGVICKYTSTRSDKFFFDDFVISGGLVIDVNPPILDSVFTLTSTGLALYFNESLSQNSAEQITNYALNNGIGFPNTATRDSADSNIVHLQFTNQLQNNTNYQLAINNVSDFTGNAINNQLFLFTANFPVQYAFGNVIINEIFPDPTPQEGLPEQEYIELFNTTQNPINLKNWVFSDATSQVEIPTIIINPNEYLIVCHTDDTTLFTPFGNVVGLSTWPTLNNGGDNLSLRDETGFLIDTISYKSSWYQNSDKANGGWSLERVNPKSKCNDEKNWSASINGLGGTPGSINSIHDTLQIHFIITSAIITDATQIELEFSTSINSSSIILSNITSQPAIHMLDISMKSGTSNVLIINTSKNIKPFIDYHLSIHDFQDCEGSVLKGDSILIIRLPEFQDVLINEILFNPRQGGSDFIELYNRSDKNIDLKNWHLLYMNNSGDSAFKPISNKSLIVESHSFIVLTEDTSNIKYEYSNSSIRRIIEIDLPTYSNTNGTITILNQLGSLNDEFIYHEEMHTKILTDAKGVSLERVNYLLGINTRNNWHSASYAVGFATPGMENSQFVTTEHQNSEVQISPKTFSPNNDGYNDILSISYAFNTGAYVSTVTIHNSAGQIVTTLINNQTIGSKGTFFWDGTNENGETLGSGMYIILFRIYDLENNQFTYKNVAVLAIP